MSDEKKPDANPPPKGGALVPLWRKKPLDISTPSLFALFAVRDETLAAPAADADSVGYMARLLIQTTLPHRDPGNVEVWSRTNGNFTLQIVPGFTPPVAGKQPRRLGIPFGVYPRLFIAYLCSEAVRTGSPRVSAGHSLSDFIRKLGLGVRGGSRGTIARLRDQIARVSRATIDWSYSDDEMDLNQGIRPIEISATFWDPHRPDQTCLWPSWFELNYRFFEELMRAPVPLDMRLMLELARQSRPLCMDVYQWLTYRQHRYNERGGKPTVIPWASLAGQFGGSYTRLRAFREAFVEALRIVQVAYPQGNATPTERGLLLGAGTPHVQAPVARRRIVQGHQKAQEATRGASQAPPAPTAPDAAEAKPARPDGPPESSST